MEREAVLVGIDVGTSKVCTLIGEVSRDGRLTVMGHGTVPSSGLKKGVVVNIDQTVRSIAESVERAERLSGWKIDRAFVAVGGQHVESLNSPGQVAVSGPRKEVTREDVNRAIEVARAVSIPSNQEVLHVERRGFKVDGQEGVKDPLGMSALRLEVEVHIVTGSATAVQNLSKCVAAAGVKIDELVASALGSAEAVLSETEKELGVAVADIGAGTIALAMFADGSPFRTAVLPVGGNNVTNDVAIGLKTSLQVAEELKIRHGTCNLASVADDEEISVSVLGEEAGRTISRLEVCQIIEARMRETFELVRAEMGRAGSGMLPAGIVLTGGASQLAGTAELAREVLSMPVRVASPANIGGLVDTILTPAYSTAVGLLQWGAGSIAAGEPMRYESAPASGGLGRLRDALRSDLPLKTTELSVRTGSDPGLFDLTAACASFVDGEGDGLLNVFVPHATAGLVIMELGAGSDSDLLEALDDLLPRDGRWRHRHGSRGPWRGPRAAAARAADAQRAGRRRAASAGDVAVDRAPRPEPRQPDADGPAELPAGLSRRAAASHCARYRTIAARPTLMLVDGALRRRETGRQRCCERSWTRRGRATKRPSAPWCVRSATAASSSLIGSCVTRASPRTRSR